MYYSKSRDNSGKTAQLIVWSLLFFSVMVMSFLAHNLHFIH